MTDLALGRWDWILFSVALATLASLFHWLVLRRAKETQAGGVLLLAKALDSPWLVQPLRLIYAVGIPAALLFSQHSLTTRGLGLQALPALTATEEVGPWPGGQWTDWVRDLGWAGLVTAVTLLLVLLGDRAAPGAHHDRPYRRHDLWVSLREAIYHQAHWAFYREPFVVAWGIAIGGWLGALPVAVETILNPMVWEGMRREKSAYARQVVVRAGLYVATTLIFLKAQNIWVATAADVLLGWLLLPSVVADDVAKAPIDTQTDLALQQG